MSSIEHHLLINRDDPRCLYCKSMIDYFLSSDWISNRHPVRLDREKLTCRKCGEIFDIFSTQDDIAETAYYGFLFSCKGLYVYQNYLTDKFLIGDSETIVMRKLEEEPVEIPSFNVDFSDKNKLHEKLKTYLIFS